MTRMEDARSESGAPADQDVTARVDAIREDRVHGSTDLAMQAVRVLADAAAADLNSDWAGRLSVVAEELALAKPPMAAVGNSVKILL